MKDFDRPILSPMQMAKLAKCSVSTVINYSNQGLIETFWESNGYRKFTYTEAIRLREMLEASRRARNVGASRSGREHDAAKV